ncbi:MAG TPA: hypothetical protein PLC54_04000 [Spirochaetales bacterium]|nr:hypothetical protein [Spirochaetales bacterium]
MKQSHTAEGLLRAYFQERIREEDAVRNQQPRTLSTLAIERHSRAQKSARGASPLDTLRSALMAAACLAVLVSVTLVAPTISYDAGVLHDAVGQLKAQADKIELFAPFVSVSTSTH